MKEAAFSNCEREFILQIIADRKRLDGRECYDYRDTKITFGIDRGSCSVDLGNTKVMCQVSCEVTPPKLSRTSDGIIFLNVELSPMAALHYEAGRQSEVGVEINRIVERCIKESRCVDTESLCIISGSKVWTIRVDLHVLNSDGNIIDCASIAAISALAHFRRPEVSVSGEEVIIHSPDEKDLIPLSVHHMPVCVTLAFFYQGKHLLVDPTDSEERVMDGRMIVGMNKHREICAMQVTGSMLLLQEQVLRCCNVAVVKVTEITELIQKALENDAKARSVGQKFGFAHSLDLAKLTVSASTPKVVDAGETLRQMIIDDDESNEEENMSSEESESSVQIKGPGTSSIGEGGPNTWGTVSDDEDEEVKQTPSDTTCKNIPSQPVNKDCITLDDSEEEEVIMLEKEDLQLNEKKEKSSGFDLTASLQPMNKSKKKLNKNKRK